MGPCRRRLLARSSPAHFLRFRRQNAEVLFRVVQALPALGVRGRPGELLTPISRDHRAVRYPTSGKTEPVGNVGIDVTRPRIRLYTDAVAGSLPSGRNLIREKPPATTAKIVEHYSPGRALLFFILEAPCRCLPSDFRVPISESIFRPAQTASEQARLSALGEDEVVCDYSAADYL